MAFFSELRWSDPLELRRTDDPFRDRRAYLARYVVGVVAVCIAILSVASVRAAIGTASADEPSPSRALHGATDAPASGPAAQLTR